MYNLTRADYQALRELQNDSCAICGIHQDDCKGSLHIDHCHITRKVRGLLCRHCNQGLGHFRDSKERLIAAITYLAHD